MMRSEDAFFTLDQQVCFPLYAATNLIQQLYRPLLKPLGLTYTQYLVMMVLWEAEAQERKVAVGDLYACLHLGVGTMSPLLKRMEKSLLIVRQRNRDDERRVLISLTEAGSMLRERARNVPKQLLDILGIDPVALINFRHEAQSLVRTLSEKIELINSQDHFLSISE